MQAARISATEISLTPEMYPILDHKQVEAYAKKYGVELWSYHLPFHPFTELDPSSLDGEIRKHTLEYFTELIKKGSDIGIDKFIVHPSGERIYDEERADRMKYSMESMDKLAEIAYKHGARIAIEDLPRTCLGNTADEVLQLISVNDKLRVCFDTNHLLKDDQIQFMDKLADKIITVHISDYDYVNERHWLPGEGKIDWNAFIEKFNTIGYKGVWMYEIGLKCPKTILRDRDLTYTDFMENAKCLFEGRKPPIFSRQKENLGWWE
jgi:sugar phosphate isomerase/epimerase